MPSSRGLRRPRGLKCVLCWRCWYRHMSRSAKTSWIEIDCRDYCQGRYGSRSAKTSWIEMIIGMAFRGLRASRSAKTSWIEI